MDLNKSIKYFFNIAKSNNKNTKLMLGEPNYKSPLIVKFNIIKNILKNNTKYSDSDGIKKLRDEIIKKTTYYKSYNNPNIIITNGASEALFLTFFNLVKKDDEIIIFKPFYPTYLNLIKRFDAKEIIVDTTNTNYQLDDSILNLINNKTKLIIINTPNNPTGKIFNTQSLNILNKIIEQNKNIYLIFDLVYNNLIFEKNNNLNILDYFKNKKNILIINSFSKTYAMTGYRIGYIIFDESLNNLKYDHALINSSLNTFTQYASIKALKYNYNHNLKSLINKKNYTIKLLNKFNLNYITPDAGLYIFINIKKYKISSVDFFYKLLKNYNLGVIPGICFGDDNYIRICISNNKKLLKKSIININNQLKSISSNLT